MSTEEPSIPFVAVTAAVGAIVLLVTLLCNVFQQKKKEVKESAESEDEQATKTNDGSQQKEKSHQKKQRSTKARGGKAADSFVFSHSWLATTLKGHSNPVVDLDFSSNGKYLVSSSEDRALMLWSVKEFEQKDKKFVRNNVDLDSASKVAFSPDSKAFITALQNENAVRIFRLGKKDDGSGNVSISEAATFPKKHDMPIIGLGISSSGRFIMTCSGDTTMIVWDLRGEVLATIDTHQMNNSCGKVSPCGRFVASSGFTPDVKVWEVVFDKTGNFKEVKRAFELKGHKAGIYSFDFNNDSSRMASVSKDNTWKYWNTNVQYKLEQDAKLLYTGTLSFPAYSVSLSPDGRTAAMASHTSIAFWDAVAEREDEVIENVHAESMSCMSFDVSGRYLVTAGGKHIQVLHNVTGHRAVCSDLEAKVKTASGEGMKERLREQIAQAQKSIDRILTPSNGHAA